MKAFLILAAIINICLSCDRISLESDSLDIEFSRHSSNEQSGRTSYVSVDDGNRTQYLYHVMGLGRWVLNDDLDIEDRATAFVDSWAIEPYLIDVVNDGDSASKWKISSSDEFLIDTSIQVFCLDDTGDKTVYFDSSDLKDKNLSGFFVLATHPTASDAPATYSHIKFHEDSQNLYMYKLENKWLIGETLYDENCISFLFDDAIFAHDIVAKDWHYLVYGEESEEGWSWVAKYSSLISKESFKDTENVVSNVFEALRITRSISSVPEYQQYITLRNQIPMPTMGLGTGGLYAEETFDTLVTAMKLGYRLFDLAREYNNEKTFADVVRLSEHDASLPSRDQLFIASKVWPTDLGVKPTSAAIETSLEHLNSNYVDQYLLHWPVCDASIEWMHCETTVDPNGTWRDSWRTLEKAYAEGRVMSIGVSNFDVNLLEELLDFAVVKPHAVQNFATPGSIDTEVRLWCKKHEVVYQPYASIRNLDSLPEDLTIALKRIASNRGVSIHSVATRFFIQSGASVIPRSRDESHLRENLEAFKYSLDKAEMEELGWNHSEL